MKKKKVLVVTGPLRMGGLERVAINCVKYSDSSFYNFDFLVLGNKVGELENEAVSLGCKIIHTKSNNHNLIRFYNDIINVMRVNGNYDIVHSHIFFYSGIIMLAAAKCGIPIRIAHSHSIKRKGESLFKKLLYHPIMRYCLNRFSTKYCACSEMAGEYLFGKRNFNKNGIIIPNIINPLDFQYNIDNRDKIRNEFHISQSQIVIGFIGHLTAVKNPMYLLKIFEKIQNKDDYKLLIIGDGALRSEIEGYINDHALTDKVILTGIRHDVPNLLSAMDVLVCTSTNEGFGIILLEAQANSLPCVVEKHAIVKEIIDLGNCSVVSSFENVDLWVNAIQSSIEKGRLESSFVSLNNSIYTPQTLVNILKELYS